MKRALLLLLCFTGFFHALADEGLECQFHRITAAAPPTSPDYRKYAPDRKVDILHLSLDITPDFAQRTITGKAAISFSPLGKPLNELSLDAVDLNVTAVKASVPVQNYQVTDEAIIVTFETAIPVGKEVQLLIDYGAQPRQGLYFRTPEMGYPKEETHLWTQGELTDHRYWYPSHDFPNEKFTTEIICRVPEGMTVLSNGKLVKQEKEGSGLEVVHWRQDKPHVNYLVTLVAGYFKKIEDSYRNMPLAFYVPPAELDQAQNSFRTTKDNLAFFEKEIGVPYPWEKYYQVVVRDFVVGGMENTSLTTLTDRTLFTDAFENTRSSESLVAHELAHQWFGDLITCKDWSHIWLNEGFATYYALLYDQHKNGRDAMLYSLWQIEKMITSKTNEPRPIVYRKYDKPIEQFGYLAYQKGAVVLQMLRAQLGEDLYRKCIKTFLERYQYDTVVTENLNDVIEELSGRSHDRFFDQWVYGAHHPELQVDYSWDEKGKVAKFSVKQTQKVSETVAVFEAPLRVRFGTKSGEVDHTATIKELEEDFYFRLDDAPRYVIVDPEMELLAKVVFRPSTGMLHAQLADSKTAVARVMAAEQLGSKDDHQTVAKLKKALNSDAFWGVRMEAAKALQGIHNDEALQALIESRKQDDARVRKQVVASLGGFFSEKVPDLAKAAFEKEKNPEIRAQAIRALGPYGAIADPILGNALNSTSYRQGIADAAISAIRDRNDPAYAPALQAMLTAREQEFTSRSFASALDTLAYISREAEDKQTVREFLSKYVTHKREGIRLGAIAALGTLEDPKAMALLETFASASKETPERAAAEKALETIRTARKSADNLADLRKELLEVKKVQRATSQELELLKKKLEAPAGKGSQKTKR